jgi:hypothetical protein
MMMNEYGTRRSLLCLLLSAMPLLLGQAVAWMPPRMELVIPVMVFIFPGLPAIALVSWIAVLVVVCRSGVGSVMGAALAVAAGVACCLALVLGTSQMLSSEWVQYMK